jgi:hypothetical protein
MKITEIFSAVNKKIKRLVFCLLFLAACAPIFAIGTIIEIVKFLNFRKRKRERYCPFCLERCNCPFMI